MGSSASRAALLLAMVALGCRSGVSAAPPTDGGPPDLVYVEPAYPTGQTDAFARKPYPIILAHGMSGFKNIGPLNYFYGVAEALRNDGHDVHVSKVDAFNSSEARGAQLQAFVEGVLASTGAAKVNLIGHSQGGFDVRYVAHEIPDRVAAVITIATPHLGDPIADIALDRLPGPLQDAMAALLDIFGGTLDGTNGDDSRAAINLVSTAGAAAFTARFPYRSGVAYFSIAGRSNMASGDDVCGTPTEAPFVARWNHDLDPVNPLLSATAAVLNNSVTPRPSNDGLVPVGSAKWGSFLGCIPADHLDEVGQIAGQSPGAGNAFDHILFYRQMADWLVSHGF